MIYNFHSFLDFILSPFTEMQRYKIIMIFVWSLVNS